MYEVSDHPYDQNRPYANFGWSRDRLFAYPSSSPAKHAPSEYIQANVLEMIPRRGLHKLRCARDLSGCHMYRLEKSG